MISLLYPGMLVWLAAASIPIIIHLMTRRTRQKMDLPTVQFLRQTMAHQSRIYRWQQWLLLLLRTLALIAIVLCFAQPAFMSPLSPQGSGQRAVVVILDTSASMTYTEGVSTFSKAKGAALKTLYSPGISSGNVVFCDSHPHAAAPEPVTSMAFLEQAVSNAQPTEERGDPTSSINMAVEQLGKSNGRNKQIYIISDFQRSNWADVKFESVPSNINITFVSVGGDHSRNLGITDIRLSPKSPRIGEPVLVDSEVFNSSGQPLTIPVTLTLNNGIKQSQSVTIQPYASAIASFVLQFDSAQRAACTVSLPDDSMECDNSRRIVIDLRKRANVLLVTDEDWQKNTQASFFIAHALHPDPQSPAGFQVAASKPAGISSALLHAADAVIICDTPLMSPLQIQSLSQYVKDGGNLVWVLTGDKIAEQLTGFNRSLPSSEPLPLTVDHVADLNGNGKGFVTLAEARYESPLLKAFKDQSVVDLSKAKFRKICVTDQVAPNADVLLKYEDGTAAAVHTVAGSGSLLLLNMSPDPKWSDIAKQPVFLPLLHEFLKGMLNKNTIAADYVAGGSAAATIPSGKAGANGVIACSGPSGDVSLTIDRAAGSILIDRLTKSGFYNITQGSDQIDMIAANVDSNETDLRTIDPRELESQQKQTQSYFAALGNAHGFDPMSGNQPLWQYPLAAAILFLLFEQWLVYLKPKVRHS